ncbi:Fur family transcriptional regulator [Frigidibacter sp. RF13]|uniref:Fur family transcriptional regulator n=1 Tax=Frigidibacter sp. RF13 TaxID=2997340 RepID=UPI00226FBC6D|nr:Fur family transcriptional regulator [Frigidibacter sp. RF13]MCY1127425.1 Fur family transcriptional regulator [Frigidibacter sp. RF13]
MIGPADIEASTQPATDAGLAFRRHDHSNCCGGLIARADELAAERGLKLTPVRRRALEILLEEHRALGAYEVLERLAGEGFGNKPPVAYRALDFLVENGMAHRIARLNAFMACMHPGDDHTPMVMICRACRSVAEAPAEPVAAAVAESAASAGFAVEGTVVEALGLCSACRARGEV